MKFSRLPVRAASNASSRGSEGERLDLGAVAQVALQDAGEVGGEPGTPAVQSRAGDRAGMGASQPGSAGLNLTRRNSAEGSGLRKRGVK